ncbi:hypothetical protein ERJ75_001388000 [Trypanosoma vivax]|nr:hypothetical protein ERJ75_001388000 [Trypanosoma vivax]
MCLRAWFWPPRFRVPVRAHWRTEAIDAWTGPRWQRAADKAGARRSTRGVRGERGVTQALLVTRSLFFAGSARNAGLSRAMCLACACEVPSPPPRDSAATGYGGAGVPRCMLVAFARGRVQRSARKQVAAELWTRDEACAPPSEWRVAAGLPSPVCRHH